MKWFPKYNYILASKSPRRQLLLKSIGIEFEIRIKEIEENYPAGMHKNEIPVFIAELKTHPFIGELKNNELLITADTIVWINGEVLGKPSGEKEAVKMLQQLSGNKHKVISGVCLTSNKKKTSFYSVSSVQFKALSKYEIDYYVHKFQPFDKAGSYGIQEWIGAIGIVRIEGSFYNVMGLPVQKLYEEIIHF